MKTLVTANQKGGVGKTSTVVHLAFDFLERGVKVVVIDLDAQANASFTLAQYACDISASQLFTDETFNWQDQEGITLIPADSALANLEKMPIAEAAKKFRVQLDKLADSFDVCLIDTAPSLGVRMAAALISADYVISPIELEAYAIQGIKQMMTTIANIQQINPDIQFIGMLPSKVDTRNPRHKQNLQELVEAYPELIIPFCVGLRSSIADALASKIPVWKIKRTAARKASREMRALTDHIFKTMEISHES